MKNWRLAAYVFLGMALVGRALAMLVDLDHRNWHEMGQSSAIALVAIAVWILFEVNKDERYSTMAITESDKLALILYEAYRAERMKASASANRSAYENEPTWFDLPDYKRARFYAMADDLRQRRLVIEGL